MTPREHNIYILGGNSDVLPHFTVYIITGHTRRAIFGSVSDNRYVPLAESATLLYYLSIGGSIEPHLAIPTVHYHPNKYAIIVISNVCFPLPLLCHKIRISSYRSEVLSRYHSQIAGDGPRLLGLLLCERRGHLLQVTHASRKMHIIADLGLARCILQWRMLRSQGQFEGRRTDKGGLLTNLDKDKLHRSVVSAQRSFILAGYILPFMDTNLS